MECTRSPKALAESTNSGQGGTPEKPQVQERALANERASATDQAKNAKANLRFIAQCYPTPVLETFAIESVIAPDLAKGLVQQAFYWTKELAPLNKAAGLWRSVGSSSVMTKLCWIHS